MKSKWNKEFNELCVEIDSGTIEGGSISEISEISS